MRRKDAKLQHLGKSQQDTYRGDLLVNLSLVSALVVGVLTGNHLQHTHAKRVDVDKLIIFLFIQLRCHKLGSTNDATSSGLLEDSSKAEITNFDLTSVSIDEYIVALKIPVNNRRGLRMQIVQTFKNLPGPVLDSLGINLPMLLTVPNRIYIIVSIQPNEMKFKKKRKRKRIHLQPETTRGEKLGDHVNSLGVLVDPRVKEFDDVIMFKGFKEMNLRIEPFELTRHLHNIFYAH